MGRSDDLLEQEREMIIEELRLAQEGEEINEGVSIIEVEPGQQSVTVPRGKWVLRFPVSNCPVPDALFLLFGSCEPNGPIRTDRMGYGAEVKSTTKFRITGKVENFSEVVSVRCSLGCCNSKEDIPSWIPEENNNDD